jgi:glycosyltransferase involved in cell wall biosynthesis
MVGRWQLLDAPPAPIATMMRANNRPSVIYSGSLAQPVGNGGLAWLHLQFILGLQRLGCDVLFLDRLEPSMCIDTAGNPTSLENSANLRYFLDVMSEFGLTKNFSLIYNGGERVIGRSREDLLRQAPTSDLLLNVMGFLNDEEILSRIERRVFVDIDPGFGQMWRELGWHDPFQGHNNFVTLGRNIGRKDCAIPDCGLHWITMPQPIVLDHWPAQPINPIAPITGIGAWRGPNAPIEYRGHTYGLRVHEFRKFIELPVLCPGTQFELALDIHPSETNDIQSLCEHHWSLVDPKLVAATPSDYRAYISRSKAELMIPKQLYVDANSGLLSDRSVCYLASGRPVLARDPGIGELYPIGEGLLTFSTVDEAALAVEAINKDYERHAKAARQIAVEHFDSDKVLAKLLADLHVN